jgi:hypothetical protein
MNLLRVVGDVESVRPNQVILMLHQLAHTVVQLPGDLNTTGPIVGIGYWSVPILGQSRGFSVEDQIHEVLFSERILKVKNRDFIESPQSWASIFINNNLVNPPYLNIQKL